MTDYTPEQQITNRRMLIDAMISDDYTQAVDEMRIFKNGKPCYCASGLACELSKLGQWEHSTEHDTAYYHIPGIPEDEQRLGIPDPVSHFYGFSALMSSQLIYLNDQAGMTLAEIGNWLALEPQGYIADHLRQPRPSRTAGRQPSGSFHSPISHPSHCPSFPRPGRP